MKAAKKRKKQEEEAVDLPEFDEVAYMEKEIEAAKVSFVLIGLAIVVALLLFIITVGANIAIVAFFVGLAITFLLPRILKIIPWPKLDLSKFERRDWLGHGGTFLFTWLAFWILFLNVPFVDVTPPSIVGVQVWNGADSAINPAPAPSQNLIDVGTGTFRVNATVEENSGSLAVDLLVGTNNTPMTRLAGLPVYTATFSANPSTPTPYTIGIVATDGSRHETRFTFTLTVNP